VGCLRGGQVKDEHVDKKRMLIPRGGGPVREKSADVPWRGPREVRRKEFIGHARKALSGDPRKKKSITASCSKGAAFAGKGT